MSSLPTKVITSAPGKLMLFGEHSVVFGYPCLVTAVDQRLFVTVEHNGDDLFTLSSPDMGINAYAKNIDQLGKSNQPKEVRFIETLYRIFLEKYPQKTSIHVTTKSYFSSKFGFGSSSAVTVAFAKALSELYKIPFSNKELFDLCYQAVSEVQGVGSGFDIAAAIWGGTLYYIPPAKVVEPIKITKLPIVVGYTGIKADTPTLVRMVQHAHKNNPDSINKIFVKITEIVEAARVAIENQQWTKLGLLMKENQDLLRKLKVSSSELENCIEAAQKAGSFGAKLSGAGGGDCMLAIINKNNKITVENAIKEVNGQILSVNMNAEGVKIEEIIDEK